MLFAAGVAPSSRIGRIVRVAMCEMESADGRILMASSTPRIGRANAKVSITAQPVLTRAHGER